MRWTRSEHGARRWSGVAAWVVALVLAGCGGGATAGPPTVAVTPLGIWEAGGRKNTLPAVPVEHRELRAWAMSEAAGPGGLHRAYDAGTAGQFDNVHTWNEGVSEDKWVQEAVHLGMWIVPVYQISLLGDIVIFNSVEFWTDENPLAK